MKPDYSDGERGMRAQRESYTKDVFHSLSAERFNLNMKSGSRKTSRHWDKRANKIGCVHFPHRRRRQHPWAHIPPAHPRIKYFYIVFYAQSKSEKFIKCVKSLNFDFARWRVQFLIKGCPRTWVMTTRAANTAGARRGWRKWWHMQVTASLLHGGARAVLYQPLYSPARAGTLSSLQPAIHLTFN
jgi:hypothetical protein